MRKFVTSNNKAELLVLLATYAASLISLLATKLPEEIYVFVCQSDALRHRKLYLIC